MAGIAERVAAGTGFSKRRPLHGVAGRLSGLFGDTFSGATRRNRLFGDMFSGATRRNPDGSPELWRRASDQSRKR